MINNKNSYSKNKKEDKDSNHMKRNNIVFETAEDKRLKNRLRQMKEIYNININFKLKYSSKIKIHQSRTINTSRRSSLILL